MPRLSTILQGTDGSDSKRTGRWRALSLAHVLLVAAVIGVLLFMSNGRSGLEAIAATGSSDAPGLAQTDVTIRVEPRTSDKGIGDEWDVQIWLDVGTNPTHAAEVKITYNPTYVAVLSATPGTTLGAVPGWPKIASGSVEHLAVTFGGPGVQGSFVLFSMRLRALQATPSTPLTFVTVKVAKAEEPIYSYTPLNGTVIIRAATATPTRTNTPTATNTPDCTRAPSPTPTDTPAGGIQELVLRQGVDGYTGFEDNHIDYWAPTVNYHLEPKLRVGAPRQQSVLMKIDVTSLPPGTIIEEAVLTLYQVECPPHNINADVYEVLKSWVVSQATWRKANATQNWTVAGCAGPGTDRAAELTDRQQLFPACCQGEEYPTNFDITPLVQKWVNNPASNYGIVIEGSGGVSAYYKFASADSRSVSNRPKLTIRYRQATPTPTMTATPTDTPIPTETPTPSTGTVVGIVFLDENKNGQYDVGEAGVSGATIEVRSTTNPAVMQYQTSGSDGVYRFEGLDPDTYRVSLSVVPVGYYEPSPVSWQVQVTSGGTAQADFPLRQAGRGVHLPLILRNRD